MSKETTLYAEKFDKMQKKVSEFSELLNTLESTEDKKKMLWLQIYENAITDRENASMLFTDVYKQMQSATAEHAVIGPILSKYIERMGKSNEQLIKLAELIAKAEERAAAIDPDDIFSQIQE